MARAFGELEFFCCAFHIFSFFSPCFVLTLRRPSTSLPSRRSLRTTSRRGDSAIGFRYSRSCLRPVLFAARCVTGSGHFRFRSVAELGPATSVSGQLRNWFRPLPFPVSCGTGSGHFRFRPVAELVAVDFSLSAVAVIKCYLLLFWFVLRLCLRYAVGTVEGTVCSI